MAWVNRELRTLGIPPLKRFGQHFLIDKQVRQQLVNAAGLAKEDTVLEVGPGLGFLTTALAEKAGKVIAVEKDRKLATYLTGKLSKTENVTVIQGDALNTVLPGYTKLVSSPPYNISSKLILWLLASGLRPSTLLLQYEFVDRLKAEHGSPGYGRLSVMVQAQANIQFVTKVPRSAFRPQPRVDSAIAALTALATPPRILNKQMLGELVRELFNQRRRKLPTVFRRYIERRFGEKSREFLTNTTIPEKRVYQTSVPEFIDLSNQISNLNSKDEG